MSYRPPPPYRRSDQIAWIVVLVMLLVMTYVVARYALP